MHGETEAAPTASPEPADPIASTEAAAAESLPTVEEAAAWLSQTKPSAVIALLKDPDYRAAVTPAFNGVRPDAKSFAIPHVRSRLAQAASKDAKLAEKLRSLSEATPIPPPVSPSAVAKPAKSVLFSRQPSDPLPALRAERDARRRERDDARAALAAAAAERDAAAKARLQAESERDEAQKLAKKQAERIARLERQMAQAKQTEARLVKALNEDKVSPPPAPRPRSTGPTRPALSAAWPAAVKHLLDRGKFGAALALAEDVLKSESEDLDALQIAAEASERHGEPRQAVSYFRRLLALQSRRPDIPAAGETLLAIFRLLPAPEMAEPDVRVLLAALTPTDSAQVSVARLVLNRLRGLSPNAHAWLAGYIAERTALAPVLIPPPDALGPDDPLPLELKLGRPITARHLTDAVDQMQTALVSAARAALASLETDPDASARVWAALEQAAADDLARLLPLRRTPRGAAVVDGSNVAWFDQEALVHGRPRLRPLLAMRRMLWSRGFFPVVLYADANLPYFIDDKQALRTLRDQGALTFVDAGTTADEALLRVAKQMNAPLITNDKMEDWDPNGEVRKVRYAVSMTGEAHLLSEI